MAHEVPARPLTPEGPWGLTGMLWPIPALFTQGRTHDRTEIPARAQGHRHRSPVCRHRMRMTEQRRVIARVLAEAADHPDVEELYRRCVTVDDKISISTVYRTVKLFEDAGIIERHDFREGRARYEQMRDSHHDHLINLRDGKVIEFTNEEIEKLQAEIARKLGYKLIDHRLELYCIPLEDDKS